MVAEVKQPLYFKTVHFQNVQFWDYYNLTKQGEFTSKYPIVTLGQVLQHRKQFIEISDDHVYKRCRVQLYANGVIIRDQVPGKIIKTKKQQLCKTDDFLVAEIDAKFGGYGLVPSNLEGAIVSAHYFLYEIDKKKLLPEYLALVVKFNNFSKQVKPTGSTNYAAIRPHDVLHYKIPLPSLNEQRNLVDTFNKRLDLAHEQEKRAEVLSNLFENKVCRLLGVKIKQAEIKKGLSFFSYKEVTKWTVDYILKQSGLSSLRESKYTVMKLGQVIEYLQYGISEKSNVNQRGTPVLRMNNIQSGKIDFGDLKHYDFENSKLNKEKVLLSKGDLLFNRTNSKELVGKTAVFNVEGEFTFASYLIRLRFNKETNPHFVNYVLNSPIGRIQIDLMSRQILGQANVNSEELKEILIPLPPLKIQNEIVKELNGIIAEKEKLSDSAAHTSSLALNKFEQSIFIN